MGKDKDVHDIFAKEKNKKQRTVKYHKHGILSKVNYFKANEEKWVFETENEVKEFEGVNLEFNTVLDDLSKQGYELVCSNEDGDYILRTKNEIEEVEEYWDTD